MSNWQDDQESSILAVTYGFNPAKGLKIHGVRDSYAGKYEPDNNRFAASRTIVLAGFMDSSNCLVKYSPSELVPPTE